MYTTNNSPVTAYYYICRIIYICIILMWEFFIAMFSNSIHLEVTPGLGLGVCALGSLAYQNTLDHTVKNPIDFFTLPMCRTVRICHRNTKSLRLECSTEHKPTHKVTSTLKSQNDSLSVLFCLSLCSGLYRKRKTWGRNVMQEYCCHTDTTSVQSKTHQSQCLEHRSLSCARALLW